MFNKKSFDCDDRVKFVKTGGDLDGKLGTIIGKSFINVIDSYIVLLDGPIEYKDVYDGKPFLHKAITMTESCLEKI